MGNMCGGGCCGITCGAGPCCGCTGGVCCGVAGAAAGSDPWGVPIAAGVVRRASLSALLAAIGQETSRIRSIEVEVVRGVVVAATGNIELKLDE